MLKYDLIEHTADVGVRIKGKTTKELFKNAALAIFDIIAEKTAETKLQKKIKVNEKAESIEELLVNWLNELLYFSATKNLIFSSFSITKLNDKCIESYALGHPTKNYRINTEIKAATYHQLKIKRNSSGWQGQVIFDV